LQIEAGFLASIGMTEDFISVGRSRCKRKEGSSGLKA
jgi:hypothetical protein